MPHASRLRPFLALTVLLSACSAAEKLVSSVTGGGNCSGPVALAVTGSVSGSTNGVSCKFPDGGTGNLYSITAAQPTNVEVTVTPNGFPAYLGAWTSGGALLGQTNATPTRLKLFLAAGSYQFGVGSTSNKDGSFSVATAPADVTACLSGPGGNLSGNDMGAAMKGAVVAGTLTNADCGNGTNRGDGYTLTTATANSSWSFTVTADRGVNLEVWSGSQNVGFKSMNAAGTITLNATAPSATDFRFFVSGTPGSGTINYTVTVN